MFSTDPVRQPALGHARTLVLYHENCNDGFTAAWEARKALGYVSVAYLPCSYGKEIDVQLEVERLYLLDFSVSLEKYNEWYAEGKSIVILDHHKTAMEELKDLPGVHIDESHCGAYWTWLYFNNINANSTASKLVQYVEDRDCWRWELPYSREVSAYIFSLDYDFNEWAQLESQLEQEDSFNSIVSQGTALLRHQSKSVDYLIKNKAEEILIDGYTVMAVNSIMYQSEIGEALNNHYKCDFAAIYYHDKGDRAWSLRSQGDMDVSQVAKKFGGGGHPNAAGFVEKEIVNYISI